MPPLPARVKPRPFDSFAEAPRRAFGSDYAPQSQTYLLLLPFLLGICGAAVWAFPTDAMFVVGSLAGSLIGLYVLVDIIFRSAPLRLTTIYGMTVLLGYNLGSFNTWLTMDRGGLSVAESFARDPVLLGRAIGACMVTAAVFFVVGEVFEHPLFGGEFRLTFGPSTLPLIVFTTILILIAYARGKVGFGGIVNDEGGHIDPLTSLIVWWYVPAFAYSVCAALNTTGLTRWAIRILTLIQLVALVPLGRRQFAFGLLLALIATRLGKYRLRLSFYKKLLLGLVGAALITIASVAFLYLRVAGYQFKGRQPISLGMRLESVYDLVHKRGPTEILGLLGENVSTRTFVIAFFSDLLDASQRSTPLLGRDILYNIQLTVPSAISSDKFGIAPYDEETLANMQWGFSYRDEANTLLTAGAADFGFLGVLAYPILLTFMLRIALEWIQLIVPTRMAVITALAFVFQSLLLEDVPVSYFLQIRSVILVVIIYYIFIRLPRFKLHSAGEAPAPF